jgi:hypothetical protein
MLIDETEEQQPDEQGVAIYSKSAVLWFAILFSPIAGGILLMLNLRSAGYKKEGYSVLFFSLAYYVLSRTLLGYLNQTLILSIRNLFICTLILDIIGGGILAEYFFKKHFPDNDYEHKSILKPLFILLLVIIPLSLMYMTMVHK